jgi:hypothetical protein
MLILNRKLKTISARTENVSDFNSDTTYLSSRNLDVGSLDCANQVSEVKSYQGIFVASLWPQSVPKSESYGLACCIYLKEKRFEARQRVYDQGKNFLV